MFTLSLRAQERLSVLDHIGGTPLLRLNRILPKEISSRLEVYAKAEWFNPGGSVKDRPAYRMVCEGLNSGVFQKGQTLIDSTSGNTGIAYAMIGAAMDFPVELVVPKNISYERKMILEAYGAKMTYTDPLKGSDGARQAVREIVSKDSGHYFFPDQYSNDSNWLAHYETTGPEIWKQTRHRITHFIAGTGTSGTLVGAGRFLKEKNRNIKIVAVQPEAFHGIEGLKNMDVSVPVRIYDPAVHDEKITIPTEPAYEWTRELAAKEGLLVGPSSGAALYGALQVTQHLEEGVVVVVFPDGGDKYLSSRLWMK